MIYGDHFGISDSNNKDLAKALGKDPSTWSKFDDAQMQRVPLMFHIPGYTQGGIQHQYGGEIDVLPTLLHLVGVDSSKYIQFGTDLFSSQHDQTVAFRNGDFVTPNYTELGGQTYDNKTGEVVDTNELGITSDINQKQKQVKEALSLSDKLNQENLLRFYTPEGFSPIDPKDFEYKNLDKKNEAIEKAKGNKSTSVFSKNGNKTTADLYPSIK